MLEFVKSKKLLNIDNNAKTVKGQKYGFITAILYLAPSTQSGFNVCPLASEGCKNACLYSAVMVLLIVLNKVVSIKRGGIYKREKVF